VKKYTKEELQEVTKARLYDLAEYYDLDVSYRLKKDEMIDVILEYMNKHIPEIEEEEKPDTTSDDDLPEMSVRIRRIYEANRK
jgi:hypothetical protein